MHDFAQVHIPIPYLCFYKRLIEIAVGVAWKIPALAHTEALFNDSLGLKPRNNKPEEDYDFDDNISKQLCVCSRWGRGANVGQHFPAPY